MAVPTPGQWTPGSRGGIVSERLLYTFTGVVIFVHALVGMADGYIRGMVNPDVCADGPRSWVYATIHFNAFTFAPLLITFWLLWHTLWRWAYTIAFVVNLGFAGMHAASTFYYFQYLKTCESVLQCSGACALGPEFPITPYFKAHWALTGVMLACCLLYLICIVWIRSYVEVQSFLWFLFGSSDSSMNYNERIRNDPYNYQNVPGVSGSQAAIESRHVHFASKVQVQTAPPATAPVASAILGAHLYA